MIEDLATRSSRGCRLALQLGTLAALVACAVVEVVLRSDPLVTDLGIGAVVLGCLSLLRPREPLPTSCLILLMTGYAVAIHPFPSDRQLWSVLVVSVLLYIIHSGLGILDAAYGVDVIETDVLVHALKRTGCVLAASTPIGALMILAASTWRAPSWVLALGVAAAVAIGVVLLNVARPRGTASNGTGDLAERRAEGHVTTEAP
jgi:hypothetical protein